MMIITDNNKVLQIMVLKLDEKLKEYRMNIILGKTKVIRINGRNIMKVKSSRTIKKKAKKIEQIHK